jgi:RNA polymerase sigma factor (TIGR02999 family)
MTTGQPQETAKLLNEITAGDCNAAQQLMPLVYTELQQLARGYFSRESPAITLQPTALVNEAYLKLVDQTQVDWQGQTHFFAVAAQAMRRILVDHARGKKRAKRGGGRPKLSLDDALTLSPDNHEDLIALDDVLEKLAEVDPRQARIVELRFFGGLTLAEIAKELGVSERTIGNEWAMVRAWLRRELSEDDEP